MGSLLKEALKCLCGDKQWSYAIFWKIACRNPSLLVWEESYYEPVPCSSFSDFSGNESTELLLKEWEKLLLYNSQLSQHGRPSVDRVSLLINKMMMSNQVYVVGEGIVGRAAFTGSHQWILQENHIVNHPSEVLAELHQQFSAGMQTVAVIPVNPHGVVQLGSCQTIMETKRFVNELKSLFMHLGGVPGALWSGNYNGKEVSLKTGKPLSLEIPVCTGSGNACSQVGNVISSTRDSCSDKISATPASGHISQPSHSLMQEDVEDHMLKLQRAPAMTKFCNGLSPLKAVSVMKPNSLSEGRLETGAIGAEMIFSSLDTWLNQWASHNARSGLNHGLPVGQSDITSSIPASIKQQVPFDIGLREPVNNSLRSLNSINPSQLRSNGGTVTDSLNDSVVSILEGCESSNASSNNSKLTSNPCSHSIPCRSEAINSSSSVEVMGHQFVNCSKIDIVPSSCHANHSRSVGVFPEVPKTSYHTTSNKDAQTELAARKQGIENDLFQALNIQSDLKDEHNFGREPMLDCLHDCLVSRQKHDKANPSVGNIASPDAHSRGNDLFDILGFDFRSERPKSWNNLQIYGADATTQNAYISPCTTHLEPDPNFYAANEWMSESGIFSESRPDHLLEAMVSKIYCPDKQNSDDTESCRTTLTMISGSSIPTGSPKHSQASVSNQMRVDSGLPPRLAKSGIVGSSSSKSGSSKGNAGECSQTNTIYGSQISSWVEEGQNMKRGNSIITACSKGPDEIMKSNRKRLRPGESPRPRPKDRQMIQDRVKELREIVPNGAKCSIDALLERTIKHMLFLQSVTKHADKLKQTGESKIISKDGGLLLRDNFEGGATWAFELGSRSMVCPIIVEDLNPPRQMLVEMLCEEHGFFLEIADIIRGLGLTILKGVMEARNDKIWARFAVEANRDVTRMEIFLALVRLLEQTMKGIGSTEGVNNDKLGMNHPLHPVSIPATGSSNAFH